MTTYLDFDLKIGQGTGRDHPVEVRSPSGEAQAIMRFPFDEIALYPNHQLVAQCHHLIYTEGSVSNLEIGASTMPTLHVRSVPEDVYNQLRSLAQVKQRSLSAQVVAMLERALEIEAQQQQQAQLLETVRRRRFIPPASEPESTELLREDRRR
jgi:hypothetical protein